MRLVYKPGEGAFNVLDVTGMSFPTHPEVEQDRFGVSRTSLYSFMRNYQRHGRRQTGGSDVAESVFDVVNGGESKAVVEAKARRHRQVRDQRCSGSD